MNAPRVVIKIVRQIADTKTPVEYKVRIEYAEGGIILEQTPPFPTGRIELRRSIQEICRFLGEGKFQVIDPENVRYQQDQKPEEELPWEIGK